MVATWRWYLSGWWHIDLQNDDHTHVQYCTVVYSVQTGCVSQLPTLNLCTPPQVVYSSVDNVVTSDTMSGDHESSLSGDQQWGQRPVTSQCHHHALHISVLWKSATSLSVWSQRSTAACAFPAPAHILHWLASSPQTAQTPPWHVQTQSKEIKGNLQKEENHWSSWCCIWKVVPGHINLLELDYLWSWEEKFSLKMFATASRRSCV